MLLTPLNYLYKIYFQHELDHLDGILFYNRAKRYHREQAMKKWEYGGI